MSLVSVTRARIRRPWSFPPFALAAMRSFRQAQAADGFLGGSVLPDRRLTFWTMTVWVDETAMRNYMLAGPHRAAMPKFGAWCDEASVVHWDQPGDATPNWLVAAEQMRRQGRASKLRHPSPNHATLAFADPRIATAAPIPPAPSRPRS
jgi:hypothetical protein